MRHDLMWTWSVVLLLPLILGASSLQTPVAPEPPEAEETPQCASCTGTGHFDPPIDRPAFETLIDEYARGPMSEDNLALETLLYHGSSTLGWLDDGEIDLDPARRAFLTAELLKDEARIELRILDEHGVIRAGTDEPNAPFGLKQHLNAQHLANLQDLEFNGTVKRVGLHHIWARF